VDPRRLTWSEVSFNDGVRERWYLTKRMAYVGFSATQKIGDLPDGGERARRYL
jgi:hypothetical protein